MKYMSFEINWHQNFGILWAYEKERFVVSTVFEDKKEAMHIAKEIENWSVKFTRLTIIEKDLKKHEFFYEKSANSQSS